eukprot:489243-Hanusia_phi.AAC.1
MSAMSPSKPRPVTPGGSVLVRRRAALGSPTLSRLQCSPASLHIFFDSESGASGEPRRSCREARPISVSWPSFVVMPERQRGQGNQGRASNAGSNRLMIIFTKRTVRSQRMSG